MTLLIVDEPPRCRTSHYRRTFIPLSVSLLKDLADPVFDGVGLEGFKNGPMPFHWPELLYPFLSSPFFKFIFFCLYVVIVGLGSLD